MKRIGQFILLAVLLSGCQSLRITDLLAPSGSLLYTDDFTDPASGWPAKDTANGSEGYSDGNYFIRVETPDFDMWAVPGQVFKDVTVETDANKLAGPDENRYGLVCRYQGDRYFYFFVISSDGYYAIGKILDGTASLLGQEMMAYSPVIVPGAGPNLLRFDCINSTLTGYVNGMQVATAQDTDFPAGQVGLIAGAFAEPGVQVSFGTFLVIKP